MLHSLFVIGLGGVVEGELRRFVPSKVGRIWGTPRPHPGACFRGVLRPSSEGPAFDSQRRESRFFHSPFVAQLVEHQTVTRNRVFLFFLLVYEHATTYLHCGKCNSSDWVTGSVVTVDGPLRSPSVHPPSPAHWWCGAAETG